MAAIEVGKSAVGIRNDVNVLGDIYNNAENLTRAIVETAVGGTVARQVTTPASATSVGQVGDYAVSASFGYFYTGDGTTHSWVRFTVAAW